MRKPAFAYAKNKDADQLRSTFQIKNNNCVQGPFEIILGKIGN